MTICSVCHGRGYTETPVYVDHYTMGGHVLEPVLARIDHDTCGNCGGEGTTDIRKDMREQVERMENCE